MKTKTISIIIISILISSCGIHIPPSSNSKIINQNKLSNYKIDSTKSKHFISASFYEAYSEYEFTAADTTNQIKPDYFKAINLAYNFSKSQEYFTYAIGGSVDYGGSRFLEKKYNFINANIALSASLDLFGEFGYIRIPMIEISSSSHFGTYEDLLKEFDEYDNDINGITPKFVWPSNKSIQTISFGMEAGIFTNEKSVLYVSAIMYRMTDIFYRNREASYYGTSGSINYNINNKFLLSIGVNTNFNSEFISVNYGLTFKI